MKTIALVISCEHAVNTVPEKFQGHFIPHQPLLHRHEGIDLGALAIAEILAERLGCILVKAQVTRLLIDLNRSLHHPRCFSIASNSLSTLEKEYIIQKYYLPYRSEIIQKIANFVQAGQFALHISVHSFTSFYQGKKRNADLGILYDPGRAQEKNIAKLWQEHIRIDNPQVKVRRNYPYLGKSDGFTTELRKQFSDEQYAGIEIEINQSFAYHTRDLRSLGHTLACSLESILSIFCAAKA